MAIRVETPLGPDALGLVGFSGREGISQLFRFEVDVLAANERAVPFDALLGREATVVLELPDREPRSFPGICSRLTQGDRTARQTSYRLEVVPRLWLSTLNRRSRIFQDMSVPEILGVVLRDLDVGFELARSYDTYDYCVQYRESDFAFASRLMEEEGIFYFELATPDGSRMVVTDVSVGRELPALRFDPRGGPGTIFSWEKSQRLRATSVVATDFDPVRPGEVREFRATTLPAVQVGEVEHTLTLPANSGIELADLVLGFRTATDGLVATWSEEEAAQTVLAAGQSTAPSLGAGRELLLEQHVDGNGKYLITSVTHQARQDRRGTRATYRNSFECIPEGLQFRPQRTTPSPKACAEAAVVTENQDPLGRVKVRFPWLGHADETSAWARVAQPHAGSESELFWLPDVGDVVLVAFEHGDASRPVVLGTLWNGQGQPPEEGQ